MSRRDLASRLDRVERRLAPADGWQVWWPLEEEGDDEHGELVRNMATGEVAHPRGAARRPGRHIIVEYVDGAEWGAP